MGGIATPLAGAPPPTISSPGRYSGLTTPLYSHAPSTTYNPGYQPSRRYLRNVVPVRPSPDSFTPQGVEGEKDGENCLHPGEISSVNAVNLYIIQNLDTGGCRLMPLKTSLFTQYFYREFIFL
jgi:hypothetical protein